MVEQTDYGADEIQVLEGLEAVRERPGMYIGSTDDRGLHHLVYEVVDNSIDEALEGHCDEITVTIHDDNSITVEDNGRGIPVDTHEDHDAPALEVIMTVLHAGGKFDDQSYKVSGGLHGVGVSVVNALSERLEVEVQRNGDAYQHAFERGVPVQDMEQVPGDKVNGDTGTRIRFWPDKDIFEHTTYDYDTLKNRLQQLAFLNSGVTIIVADERDETRNEFLYSGGIKEYVKYLNEGKDTIHDDVIYFSDTGEAPSGIVDVEIAMQATSAVQPAIHPFVNNIHTHDGGKHLTGFKTSVTRIYNSYAEEQGFLDEIDGNLKGEDVREGLTAVISVKHPDPQFEGQTKTRLGNAEVRGIVSGIVHDGLEIFFENHPDVAQRVVDQAVQSAKARQAAKKAAELTRRKGELNSTALPGKLSDCRTRDPTDAELLIVEGDSAGGSARQGRDSEYQAVLPLKGKIINVEKHRLSRVLENDEIRAVITALGTGVGEEFDISELRYNSIIMLCDADVDGAHIRTLLLTFFYRYMRPLIENGHVYAAQPPLYRIKYKGETYDAMTEAEREEIVQSVCNGNPSQVQRFKGLGEMNPEQLWDTTLDPDHRMLKRITIEDAASADKMFSVLMGEEVKPRREFISANAKDADFIDI